MQLGQQMLGEHAIAYSTRSKSKPSSPPRAACRHRRSCHCRAASLPVHVERAIVVRCGRGSARRRPGRRRSSPVSRSSVIHASAPRRLRPRRPRAADSSPSPRRSPPPVRGWTAQQLDRLLQLRRHHQRLGLPNVEAWAEPHRRRALEREALAEVERGGPPGRRPAPGGCPANSTCPS